MKQSDFAHTEMAILGSFDCSHQPFFQIKADRTLTRDTLNAPDYWQTDNSNGLVMVIHNYHPNIDLLRTTGSNERM